MAYITPLIVASAGFLAFLALSVLCTSQRDRYGWRANVYGLTAIASLLIGGVGAIRVVYLAYHSIFGGTPT